MGIIEFKDVSFQYPNGISAVEHVSFDIQQGEQIAIIGQNGAGKTTTVKMMNGLLKPTQGSVVVDGMDTKDFTTAKLSRTTGYVFQNPDEQIFHNTVREEIEFGPRVLGFNEEKVRQSTEWAAEMCGLTDVWEENPYNLPLSFRKFVTIASVMAMDEKVLVLDEPTAGQDLQGLQRLGNILRTLREKGTTVITITHDMEFVVNHFNKIYVMAHKNLLKIGSSSEIFSDNELLAESMLLKPYISQLVSELKFDQCITNLDAFVGYLKRQMKNGPVLSNR